LYFHRNNGIYDREPLTGYLTLYDKVSNVHK
jgi:hypothetical protein